MKTPFLCLMFIFYLNRLLFCFYLIVLIFLRKILEGIVICLYFLKFLLKISRVIGDYTFTGFLSLIWEKLLSFMPLMFLLLFSFVFFILVKFKLVWILYWSWPCPVIFLKFLLIIFWVYLNKFLIDNRHFPLDLIFLVREEFLVGWLHAIQDCGLILEQVVHCVYVSEKYVF